MVEDRLPEAIKETTHELLLVQRSELEVDKISCPGGEGHAINSIPEVAEKIQCSPSEPKNRKMMKPKKKMKRKKKHSDRPPFTNQTNKVWKK